ncbi:MAG: hypothetical protein QOG04_806 [Actinomycetota bacterium]|jgi:hypothetical protein|nr:hypothetical protein [Actinomycetota bacterium]
MARKHAVHLILIALLLTACERSSLSVDVVGPRDIPGSDCSNELSATENTSPAGQEASGDVDGDGSDDKVTIALDPAGDRGCKSFLVVTARDGDAIYSTAVDPSGVPRSLPAPSLSSLVELNGDPGLEAIVNVEAGASTQFVAAFTLTDRGLEQIAVEGKGPGPFAETGQDLFAFGGSVGHIEGVDCGDNGLVHLVAAIPVGDSAETYRVDHRFFRPDGTKLVLDSSLNATERLSASDLATVPGFSTSPFGSCD